MKIKAIVTGHSRGLGAAIAAELLRHEVAVLGLARQEGEVPAAAGAAFEQVALDLADGAALQRWLAGPALSGFLAGAERVLLVNNAGVVGPVGPLAVQPLAELASAVALNVAAPLMLSQAVLAASPGVREHRIAHVSSGAARRAYAGWSVYCATKAALDQHARALALDEVAGLRICSLAPGVIDTDMQALVRSTPAEHFPMRARFEALKAEGQLVAPADAARRFVSYLLGERFGEAPVGDLRELAG